VLLEQILELSLDLILPTTKLSCITLYKEKQQVLRNLGQNSFAPGHEEIKANANIAAASGDMSSKINLDKLRSSEAHAAAMYRKIKAIRGKGGFTLIQVPESWPEPHTEYTSTALPDPKKATVWKTINLPDKIVYYLLTHNHLHFGQAQGTPYTNPPVTRTINWQASTDTSELILLGDFKDTKIFDLQSLLYQHCVGVPSLIPSLNTSQSTNSSQNSRSGTKEPLHLPLDSIWATAKPLLCAMTWMTLPTMAKKLKVRDWHSFELMLLC
jgi:hypothetical protein